MADSGPFFKPVFAWGKGTADTLDGEAGAGDNVLTVNGHSFSVGEALFVSKADDSGNQYLGAVTTTEVNTVTALWGVESVKAIGSKVWTPAGGQFVVFERDIIAVPPELDRGIELRINDGGQVEETELADKVNFVSLEASTGARADFSSLWDLIETRGVDGLSLAYWDIRTRTSKVAQVAFGERRLGWPFGAHEDLIGGSWPFVLVDEDKFVE